MRLAIDIDGVLTVFDKSYAKLLNWPLPEICSTWPDCWEWDKAAGVPQANIEQAWDHITASNHFWAELEPYPTASEDLLALGQAVVQGHDIYFLTSRPGKVAKLQSEIWLRMHGFHFAPTVLIAGGPITKGLICRGLSIDAAIDDRPENLMAIANNAPPARLFLFDRPWNRSALEPQTRVESVIEMLTMLNVTATGRMTDAGQIAAR